MSNVARIGKTSAYRKMGDLGPSSRSLRRSLAAPTTLILSPPSSSAQSEPLPPAEHPRLRLTPTQEQAHSRRGHRRSHRSLLPRCRMTVSYTHLTLPTILRV